MISKKDSKLIQQLQQKKFRVKENSFVAETPKVVEEFLRAGFILKSWYATPDYQPPSGTKVRPEEVNSKELKSISRLESPNGTLAVFEIPESLKVERQNLIIALDGVRDPGNMGTIIRMADWFNVDEVLLSEDCVDIWNPKVVQSTMGSLARVIPTVSDLPMTLSELKSQGFKILVADMDGITSSKVDWSTPTVIVMGNEANGPREDVHSVSDGEVTIPRLRNDGAESLNVAMATGILLAQAKL